jgi:hypothetical protein
MCAKIKNREPKAILEPSAGKGDIIEYLNKSRLFGYSRPDIKAIEKDPDLFASLMGKDIRVIDSNFLLYNGGDIFDLILMNPPFDEGDKHLLKAIDILYSGEIVCLLNAETIKNPCTPTRKELCKRLKEVGADVGYIQDAFKDAERKTNVEIALIHIEVVKNIEDDLLQGASDKIREEKLTIDEELQANIAHNDVVQSLVDQYQQQRAVGLKTIMDFYKNFKIISGFITLTVQDEDSKGDIASAMQNQVNEFNKNLRKDYWNKAISIRPVTSRMTSENRTRFYAQLSKHSHLDFTANNVRSFIINLIGSYEQTLIDAAVKLFDDLTTKYSYWVECDKNRLHFDTWKTNQAFKVSNKIIIPVRSSYGNAFYGYRGMELNYVVRDYLDDVDKVLNYIAGYSSYTKTSYAIENAMAVHVSSNIESTFFKKIAFYKKGTLHLTFKDETLLRKFNIITCRGKNWLPDGYGNKEYSKYSAQDKSVVDSFEGEASYTKNINNPARFARNSNVLLLEAA